MLAGVPPVAYMEPTVTSQAVGRSLSLRQAVAAAMHGLPATRGVQPMEARTADMTNPTTPPIQVLLAQNNGARPLTRQTPRIGPTRWPRGARTFYGLGG